MKMKKIFWRILLLAGLASVIFLPQSVQAKDVETDWNVYFSEAGEMEGNFDAKAVNDVVSGMQPGDTATFRVSFSNKNKETTDWYLKNDVIKSLEDSTKAAKAGGGAYTYKLTYTDQNTGKSTVLFDSEKVGGDSTTGGQGLHKATTSLDGWEYIGRHKKGGKGGLVELVVALDGETQGNRYQDTVADIQLQFGVEIPEEGSSSANNNGPSRQYGSRVKTGDDLSMTKYYLMAAAAGLILLILAVMSRRSRRKDTAAMNDISGRREIK